MNDDPKRSLVDVLADEPTNPHLVRGYGPLVVAILLFLLMSLLVPTVAEERIVLVPEGSSSQGEEP